MIAAYKLQRDIRANATEVIIKRFVTTTFGNADEFAQAMDAESACSCSIKLLILNPNATPAGVSESVDLMALQALTSQLKETVAEKEKQLVSRNKLRQHAETLKENIILFSERFKEDLGNFIILLQGGKASSCKCHSFGYSKDIK